MTKTLIFIQKVSLLTGLENATSVFRILINCVMNFALHLKTGFVVCLKIRESVKARNCFLEMLSGTSHPDIWTPAFFVRRVLLQNPKVLQLIF